MKDLSKEAKQALQTKAKVKESKQLPHGGGLAIVWSRGLLRTRNRVEVGLDMAGAAIVLANSANILSHRKPYAALHINSWNRMVRSTLRGDSLDRVGRSQLSSDE